MTDFFKDVFEAAQQRIRSPFIGSVILVFIVTNWRVLFYLFFADVSVEARIEHYDTNMHLWRNILSPIILGVCLAIVMPDIKTLGAKIARRPSRELHDLQKSEASLRRIAALSLKAEEEDALDKANEARDRRKINEENRLKDAVKRDAEVKDKFDPEEAERLQKQIDELRERPATIVAGQGRIDPDAESSAASEQDAGTDSKRRDVSEGWEPQVWEGLSDTAKKVLFQLGRSKTGKVDYQTAGATSYYKEFVVDGRSVASDADGRALSLWEQGLSELKSQNLIAKDLRFFRILPRGDSLFSWVDKRSSAFDKMRWIEK